MCIHQTFSGELAVEPGDFELTARRFIVRGSETAFEFEGVDDKGEFKIDGTVPFAPPDSSTPTQLPYHYRNWNPTYSAAIHIQKVSIVNEHCDLQGERKEIDGSNSWVFYGRLSPYET
jgi:hypothetical protein